MIIKMNTTSLIQSLSKYFLHKRDTLLKVGMVLDSFMPRICVLGSQSSGKSSLLNCLQTQGRNPQDTIFPYAEQICTKCPIELRLLKSPPQRENYYQVEGKQLTQPKDVRQFIKRKFQSIDLIDQNSLVISCYRVDRQFQFVYCDLPGIFFVQDNPSQMVKGIIQKQIRPQNTVCLIVQKATNSPNTSLGYNVVSNMVASINKNKPILCLTYLDSVDQISKLVVRERQIRQIQNLRDSKVIALSCKSSQRRRIENKFHNKIPGIFIGLHELNKILAQEVISRLRPSINQCISTMTQRIQKIQRFQEKMISGRQISCKLQESFSLNLSHQIQGFASFEKLVFAYRTYQYVQQQIENLKNATILQETQREKIQNAIRSVDPSNRFNSCFDVVFGITTNVLQTMKSKLIALNLDVINRTEDMTLDTIQNLQYGDLRQLSFCTSVDLLEGYVNSIKSSFKKIVKQKIQLIRKESKKYQLRNFKINLKSHNIQVSQIIKRYKKIVQIQYMEFSKQIFEVKKNLILNEMNLIIKSNLLQFMEIIKESKHQMQSAIDLIPYQGNVDLNEIYKTYRETIRQLRQISQ